MKVLVHSLEKTGTTTVIEAVRSAGIEVGRGHKNNIADLDLSEYTHVITMVRDPIARAISNCFELRRVNPELDIYPNPEWVAQSVLEDFGWFEKYYEPYFGWDLFIYDRWETNISARMKRDQNPQLLVMRMDDMTKFLHLILAEFLALDIDDFSIQHRSRGIDRFENYATFLSKCKFPDMMLNSVYGHKYCQTFYSPEEIEGFKKRWKY